MKRILILSAFSALWLAAAAGRAALPQPDLVARIHFAGEQNILAGGKAAPFTNEFCSAEARALRKQTADRLAPWLAGWLQARLGVAVPDGATKLRPLLDDLQSAEWSLEARTTADGSVAAALAIRTTPERAALWQAGLKPFFPAGVFQNAGGRLVFANAPAAQAVAGRLAQESAPAAGGAWLALDINWPKLAAWQPKLKELGMPETRLQAAADGTNLKIDGKLIYPENLAINLEPWRVPTNTLHQPLVSLTAVRGLAGWLKTQPWARPFLTSPVPDQLFVWALQGIPYQTYAAVPVPDATNALAQADAGLQPFFSAARVAANFSSPLKLELAGNEATFVNVPFAAPFLRAVQEPAGQFLLAGAFPNPPRSRQPLPPELFHQLAAPNLVLYHWEITALRLPQALQLGQLGLFLTWQRQLDDASAAYRWIEKTAPALGNTVTTATQTAPDQLTFSRTAPGGLTAVELVALANWLEAPDFPHCNLKLPHPAPRPKRLHPQSQSAPVAPGQK